MNAGPALARPSAVRFLGSASWAWDSESTDFASPIHAAVTDVRRALAALDAIPADVKAGTPMARIEAALAAVDIMLGVCQDAATDRGYE